MRVVAYRSPGSARHQGAGLATGLPIISAAVCAILQTRADHAARRGLSCSGELIAELALEDRQVQESLVVPASAVPARDLSGFGPVTGAGGRGQPLPATAAARRSSPAAVGVYLGGPRERPAVTAVHSRGPPGGSALIRGEGMRERSFRWVAGCDDVRMADDGLQAFRMTIEAVVTLTGPYPAASAARCTGGRPRRPLPSLTVMHPCWRARPAPRARSPQATTKRELPAGLRTDRSPIRACKK